MESLKIIVAAAAIAYISMKIRDYTKSALEIKAAKKSTSKAKIIENQYKETISKIGTQKKQLEDNLQKFQKKPVTHAVKRQIKKNKKILTRINREYDSYLVAFKKYKTMVSGKERNRALLMQDLRSYLHNKKHF